MSGCNLKDSFTHVFHEYTPQINAGEFHRFFSEKEAEDIATSHTIPGDWYI